MRKAVDAGLGHILTQAASRNIDPALVCSRNELARLIQEGAAARLEDHALLRGWRAEWIGKRLSEQPV